MGKSIKTSPKRILPSRTRTIMGLTVAVAILLAVGRGPGRYIYPHLPAIILSMGLGIALGCLVLSPLVFVETYLYRKKKGIWYEWEHGRLGRRPAAKPQSAPARPAPPEVEALRGAYGREWLARKRLRSSLFDPAPRSEQVSRATLLLTVADKLERSGKREAAKKCYRQILQGFAETAQAHEAARRLDST